MRGLKPTSVQHGIHDPLVGGFPSSQLFFQANREQRTAYLSACGHWSSGRSPINRTLAQSAAASGPNRRLLPADLEGKSGRIQLPGAAVFQVRSGLGWHVCERCGDMNILQDLELFGTLPCRLPCRPQLPFFGAPSLVDLEGNSCGSNTSKVCDLARCW